MCFISIVLRVHFINKIKKSFYDILPLFDPGELMIFLIISTVVPLELCCICIIYSVVSNFSMRRTALH